MMLKLKLRNHMLNKTHTQQHTTHIYIIISTKTTYKSYTIVIPWNNKKAKRNRGS
jgi:hypothetical protein